MKWQFLLILSLTFSSTYALTPPVVGEFCPKGSFYDGANCSFGAPAQGLYAFIYSGAFYSQAPSTHVCPPGTVLHGNSCFIRPVPSAYTPFIFQNSWYVKTNPYFVATPGDSSTSWKVKVHKDDENTRVRPLCVSEGSSKKKWKLVWSDEFDSKPPATRCYNTNEKLQCVYKANWGQASCTDQPGYWADTPNNPWTPAQRIKYKGLVDLNKCTWRVHDAYNQWESSNDQPLNERTNSLIPQNIKIENGLLIMKTSIHPKSHGVPYDCGRPTEPDPDHHGQTYTKDCAHSGAVIESPPAYPNANILSQPPYNYVGHVVNYGRIEFRAKIASMGHGAWPSLWLWGNDSPPTGSGVGELDALEFLADDTGNEDQISRKSASYGIAHQTAHNWGYSPNLGSVQTVNGLQRGIQGNVTLSRTGAQAGVDTKGYPHTADGVGLPITIGEWHTYSVEFDSQEIRMYIDGCLRNRLREGDPVHLENWDRTAGEVQSGNTTRPFKLPGNKKYHLIIGSPASAAHWLKDWYKAYGGGNQNPRSGFVSTEFQVDYVRAYEPLAVPAPGTINQNPR